MITIMQPNTVSNEILYNLMMDFKNDVNRRFNEMDRRFDEVDRRFNEVDHRFERIEDTLKEHSSILKEHTEILHQHTTVLIQHSNTLDRHSHSLANLESRDSYVQKFSKGAFAFTTVVSVLLSGALSLFLRN